MWIVIDNESNYAGWGKTAQEAYSMLDEVIDGQQYFNNCEFYEVEKATPMKQAVIPQEVIIPSNPRSKK